MRKLALIAILGLGLLAVLGADRGGTYQGGTYGSSGMSYQAGGVGVDTFRVWSKVTAFPNSAAKTANYYDTPDTTGTVNTGNAGEAVRWGYILGDAGTVNTVYYSGANQDYACIGRGLPLEDDISSWVPAGTYLSFIWVSANGLHNGDKIESAYLIFNSPAFTTVTVPSGGYIAARLDTITADYSILTGSTSAYGNTDVARFDVSWNETNATGNVNWDPALSTRADRHDFGPRSNDVIVPGSYAAGTPMRLNVTDAVQQASDNGTLGRGLLFVLYGAGTTFNFSFCAGQYAPWVDARGGKGCPVFMATASSRRGPRAWSGLTPVPVAVILDDQYPVQSSYFTAMESGGKQFDIAAFRNAVNAYTWVDSLYSLKPSAFGLIHHSRTHPSLGGLTADELAPELARGWFLQEFTGFTAQDTLGVIDCAWPGGGSTPVASVLAVSEMINFGFRSTRGYGSSWAATSLGVEYETWPSWDGYLNVYNIKAIGLSNVMGAADMADKIGDYVDLAYTDHAKSALVFFGHRNTTSPADGITPAKLTQMISITDALNSCQIMAYEDIVRMRLAGASYVRPQVASAGARTVATTDSVAIRKTAAVMDSLYAADGDPNLLQAWIEPK